jgi:hypothetical protein
MEKEHDTDLRPMPEQLSYANLLFVGAWAGIFVMMITYFLYVADIFPPYVGFSVIVDNWDKGVEQFLKITHAPHGWGWLGLLEKGDYLNYLGLVLISVLTIICYLFLMAGYRKRRDWTYFFISLVEILVLALAASGLLGTGGH